MPDNRRNEGVVVPIDAGRPGRPGHDVDPIPDPRREPDVQLAAMVPLSVKRAVRRRAEEEGTTVRSVLLKALKAAGIAEVDEAEIADRRVAAGALRSGLWRSGRLG